MGQTDQSAQLGAANGEQSSAQPVGQADLDQWKQEILSTLTQDFDKRFGGFQKILSERDRKIDNLATTLEQLKTDDLTDDERAQLEKDALAQERAAIAAERELLTLEREFPDEVDLYRKVLDAETAKDQISLLREWRTASSQNQQPEPTPQDEGGNNESSNESAIDPNNPAAQTTDGMDYQAQFERDPSLAEKLLRGAQRLSSGD